MQVFEYLGETLTFERDLATSDVVATIAEGTYKIINKRLGYTSGGTYVIVVGDILVGADSAATATVTEVVLNSGAWADGDAAGWFYIHNQVGTFNSSAEVLKVIKTSDGSAVADGATSVAGDSRPSTKEVLPVRQAKAIGIQVISNPINYTTDGTAPTTDGNTTLGGHGIQLAAGTNTLLRDIAAAAKFKFINGTAGSNAQVRFVGYF